MEGKFKQLMDQRSKWGDETIPPSLDIIEYSKHGKRGYQGWQFAPGAIRSAVKQLTAEQISDAVQNILPKAGGKSNKSDSLKEMSNLSFIFSMIC